MTPTMTGSENTVRRIDATEEGATTLAGGGSKKKEVVTVRHTTAAYLWILQHKTSNPKLKIRGRISKNRGRLTIFQRCFEQLKNGVWGRKPFCDEVRSPGSSQYQLIPGVVIKSDSADNTTKPQHFRKTD